MSGFYPHNPRLGQVMQGSGGTEVDASFIAHLHLTAAQAAVGSATGVHAAVTDTGVPQVVTTGITNPPAARNVTATAGGTAGDIKAIAVTIVGTDIDGNPLTEVLPVFTVDTAGIVVGIKAFKTVTSITIPAHDGTGATTAVGFAEKIGLPHTLEHNTVLFAFHNNVKEGTAPTVVVHATDVSQNVADLNTALNGTPVDIYYLT